MSAPTTHDPLVVNTQDGVVWQRRALTREGRGLYAVADAPACCPEYVMATLAELAEHGLASMLDALPMPVGPAPRKSRTMLDRGREALNARMSKDDLRLVLENVITHAASLEARVAELEAERHATNEALSEAAEALRASKDQPAPLIDPEGVDTLPAWLYARFTQDGEEWDSLYPEQRDYWVHQARAVGRAVARGGFKTAAGDR